MKILILTCAGVVSGLWFDDGATVARQRTCPPMGRTAAAQVLPGGCAAPQPGVLLSPDRYAALVAVEDAYQRSLDELRACRADHLALASDCVADVSAVVSAPCAPCECNTVRNGLLWCASCAVASGLVWGLSP